MKTELHPFGIVPVTAQQIASVYPNIMSTAKKVSKLEQEGRIIRLKKGLYVVSPKENEMPLSKELIANHIYAPSYVSMQTALRYYGLIPEAVYTTQSMTIKTCRDFYNSLGQFKYYNTSHEAFAIGVRIERTEHAAFTIATPEKALCDLIAKTIGLSLRYLKDVRQYLEDDIRFDMDALADFDLQLLRNYAAVGKKADSIKTLIQFISK